MKLPNAEHAIITPEKLRDYLLNLDHADGKSKAKLLHSMGYVAEQWKQLEQDFREQVLTEDASETEQNDYGTQYVIVSDLTGPNARSITFRSIWQIDVGKEYPRLITMYPETQS